MENYPKYVINFPEVISFDEFKADTKEGKLMIQYIRKYYKYYQIEKKSI